MAYKYEQAIEDLLKYLEFQPGDVKKIPTIKSGRGFTCNIDGEEIVIFTYPISCKNEYKQNFFDTRDSGALERKATWKYAYDNHMKYFCLGVNPEHEKYKDYVLSLESSEKQISDISFRHSDTSVTRTGTQVNIPNSFVPEGSFKRILTPNGFYISAIHRNHVKTYLSCFDNRPYFHDDEDYEKRKERERDELPFDRSKECARRIVDIIYDIDKFNLIGGKLENNDKNVKINTAELGGNYLRFMFAKPSSELYNESIDGKTRVFTDKEYSISLGEHREECRLSTEWVSSEMAPGANGNYVRALIAVVNQCYADFLRIYEEDGKWYIERLKKNFELECLPEVFDPSVKTRFVRSLLAKPFVILTGNSGAGKTRIAKQLSEYLEVEDENKEKNWLIVPVGADWTDNSRVMGYYNPLADNGKGKYEKTGILRLIERSNAHPDIPYFLILDEMNLSHVERYFSDFLSHMETPDNPFEIVGYTAGTVDEHQDDAEDTIVGRIRYPDNLFVVGTVNIDETTYMFSPKVLDRANVIEFKPKQKDVIDLFNGSVGYTEVTSANDGTAEAFLGLAKSIRNGESVLDDAQITIVREVFDNIYAITEKHGFEFAYRTVKEIRRYISAALKLTADSEQFDLYSVIDEQLLQKVLPKIHGNRKEIGNMLDELKTECDKPGKELPLSSAKIEQMKGKLDTVQYASFI